MLSSGLSALYYAGVKDGVIGTSIVFILILLLLSRDE
jgi:hypothetical protein